jgi:hypothetical protein
MPYKKCRAFYFYLRKVGYMRTRLPFDTEKERKPLKAWNFSISWRQLAYIVTSVVIVSETMQYTMNGDYPLVLNAILFFMNCLGLLPAAILGFKKHSQTDYFLDRHLLIYFRHKRRESGLWRRF